MIKNVYWSSCKDFNFNETGIFSPDFRKIMKYQISLKVRRVGAELYRADRRTDMTKLIIALRNFCERA